MSIISVYSVYHVKVFTMSQCEDPKPEPVEEKNSDECKKECNAETNDEDPCDPDFGGGVSCLS